MKNRLIRYLKELPTDFATNELAFYGLTNSFELLLRDKLAYRLQQQYEKFVILREWNKIDISVHRNDNIKALIEIKYTHAFLMLRKHDKSSLRSLVGLKSDYKKGLKHSKNWHGIVFVSCPTSSIPEKYRKHVRGFKPKNKYCNAFKNGRQWKLGLKDIVQSHFPASKFNTRVGLHNIGSMFDVQMNLIWFLISAKQK